MDSTVVLVSNTASYTLKLLRVDLKQSHHKKEMVITCSEVLANIMVKTILQINKCINTSDTLNSHNVICQLHLNKTVGR